MPSATVLIPDEIVDCVAAGRSPTVSELVQLAARMWVEGAPDRSAFSWGCLKPSSADRVMALRCASLALNGSAID
ncbi:MAG TPA: hypothetical protein VF649_04090 [Sphingomonas sp.]|jgi:hypothetical protein|uniref:hypothetical protein n=1 Tax=Sphingomonas sp. TaxID=28214 RepID=UPI002ED7E399